MRTSTFAIAVAAIAVLACHPGVAPITHPASADDVRERSRAVAAAEAAGDVAAVMSFWAPDAIIHVAGADPIVGQDAIRATFEQLLPSLESLRVEIARVDISASGDLAFETGINHMSLRSSSGPTAARSKYLAVWKRARERTWQIAAFSITSSTP